MPSRSTIAAAVRAQDLPALRAALGKHRGPIPAPAVIDAGRLAWQPGLALLVRHGADLNGSSRNYRALHALIQEKPHEGGSSTPERVACLEWLLAHGADPELTGAWPAARATIVAAFTGERDYVRVLQKGRGRPDIFVAAALGDATRVGALLERDAGLAMARDHGLLTALQCAAGSRLGQANERLAAGLLESARRLIDAGADVNAKTRSWGHDVAVSYFAIRSRQRELLELLLDRGLDATAALPAAAWDAREDLVDLLLAHGAAIDRAVENARPVLNELVRWGQFAQARLLLARGASPNAADDRGWTAVHQAASRGNLRMMKDLLAAGGDPTRRDQAGATPLDVARMRGRKELIALLG
jgi:ankyrin repeat protein